MAGPWERYQAAPSQSSGPWSKYGAAPKQETYEEAVASPEGQRLAGELRNKADATLLEYAGATSPAYAGITSAANTFGLNVPRNVGAFVRTMKPGAGSFDEEYAYLKDVDEAAARQSPKASMLGTGAGAIGQAALLPVQPLAQTMRGGAMQGAGIGGGLSFLSELIDSKSPQQAIGAGAVGAAVGAPLGAAASRLAGSAAPAEVNIPQVLQSAERLGIEVPSAAVSDSRIIQEAGKVASNAPFVGAPLMSASERAVTGLRDASERAAAEYGSGSGPNVANRVGQFLGSQAEREAAANAAAAQAETEAARAVAQTGDETARQVAQEALKQTTQSRLQNIAGTEQRARSVSDSAIGNVEPFDMGRAVTERLRAGEQAAQRAKTAAYVEATAAGGVIEQGSVREVSAKIAQSLEDAFQNTRIESTLTPNAVRMLSEVEQLAGLRLPSKAVGARMAAIPGQEVTKAGVTLNGIESSRKILRALASKANRDGGVDARAANIIMKEFDAWESSAVNSALMSGDPAALTAFQKARTANRNYMERFGFNAEVEADNLINKIATGEVTPQETANWIVGASKVGAQGASARLIDRIGRATENDPEAIGAIRGAIWNRLTETAQGVANKSPEKAANEIFEFLNGSGRAVADRIFDPTQKKIAELYAKTVRFASSERKAVEAGANEIRIPETKVQAVKPNVGPLEELAKRVLGSNGRTDEALFTVLEGYTKSGSRGDLATLGKVISILPTETKGDLASAFIRKMGASPRQAGEFSGDVWLSNWRTMTPQAKAMIFGMTGNLRQSLDDIATVSQRFKELNKFANPSGTARSATASGFAAWLVAEPVSAVSTALGVNVMSRVLATPATASSFSRWARAYELAVKKPTAATASALTVASRNLSSTVGEKLGVSVDPAALLRGISGQAPAAANNEQNQ
jgi:hypothetical protein